MLLNDGELLKIKGGGALTTTLLAVLGGLITLLIGVIDGYMNPLKCNIRKK